MARVVRAMQHAGRLAWRGLRLRAPPLAADGPRVWPMAMPDVFSIRHTTVEDHVEPIVHEVKVRRADLLADLRQGAKRAAYLGLASQCWYVLKAGIAQADEVPAECGVMVAQAQALEVLRPAPRRPMRLPLATWMVLARSDAEPAPDDDGQAWLGDPAGRHPGRDRRTGLRPGPRVSAAPPPADRRPGQPAGRPRWRPSACRRRRTGQRQQGAAGTGEQGGGRDGGNEGLGQSQGRVPFVADRSGGNRRALGLAVARPAVRLARWTRCRTRARATASCRSCCAWCAARLWAGSPRGCFSA